MIPNSVKADRHSLYTVTLVERIAAFRAEFRRMRRIGGLPAALVAAVDRRACRTLRTAFEQNLPVLTAPQEHVQPAAGWGSGFFAPHSGQNLPVAVAPQAHFQAFAPG